MFKKLFLVVVNFFVLSAVAFAADQTAPDMALLERVSIGPDLKPLLVIGLQVDKRSLRYVVSRREDVSDHTCETQHIDRKKMNSGCVIAYDNIFPPKKVLMHYRVYDQIQTKRGTRYYYRMMVFVQDGKKWIASAPSNWMAVETFSADIGQPIIMREGMRAH